MPEKQAPQPPAEDGWQPRTGAEQQWDPEDLAAAKGQNPTARNVERAADELAEEGPSAIDRTVP